MNIVYGVEQAKLVLLKRIPLDAEDIPPSMKQGLKEIFGTELSPQQAVERIICEVRSQGDSALLDYTRRIDGVRLTALEVTSDEISRSCKQVDSELVSALQLASHRIQSFHEAQRHQSWINFDEGGLGQIIRPIKRIGIYVPGGTASYPSTVLMTAIPARVAGVEEIIMVTPPSRDGSIYLPTMAAANIAQVDRIFKVGGAHAIAALAYGTQTIPKVDKIFGPGNIFVQLAKKAVYGIVGIDGIYGPTETLIIADEIANPALCAADLISQAEHDVLASAILITTSSDLAEKVLSEVEQQATERKRKDIIFASLKTRGGIIVVSDIEEAILLANYYAPEHLSLMVKDAWSIIGKIENAGGIFVGENSPESMGDYIIGPSHVMPTGGTARFSSSLTLNDFVKVISIAAINKDTLQRTGSAAATIAQSEGFEGHAQAIALRL